MHRRSNAAGTFATGCYTDTRYAARTWDHERRVVIKAEVVRAAPTCFLGGMGRSADGAVAAQPSRPSCPPGRLLKPRLRLQAAMSETHSCADHALWRSNLDLHE